MCILIKRILKYQMLCSLLVACDLEDNVTDKGRYMGTTTLVIEILADSTRNKDLVDKLNTYRLSGVEEYWIIEQKQENILLYSFNEYEIDRYNVCGRGETAESIAFNGLSTDINHLFDELL
ncbi:Uma2 family endonuclease [Halocella sp. SP3-1]|nr:Uma2 family endonuclease [Halocella sp. SP3-1]